MKCLNCGKTIPFSGRECAYCHTNKQAAKAGVVLGMIGGFIGFIVGVATFGTFWGILGATMAGMIPGALLGRVMT